MGIENDLIVIEFNSLEDLLEDLDVGKITTSWQDAIEEEHPDMTVFVDVKLTSLVENLTKNGIEEDKILEMNKQQYGNVVDFYKVKDSSEGIYVMLFGAR